MDRWIGVSCGVFLCVLGLARCSGGGHEATCVEGETRCRATTVQRCAAGAWSDTTDCATVDALCGVVAGQAQCVLPLGCSDGDSRCQADRVQACEQGQWVDGVDCQAAGQQCQVVDGRARCVSEPVCIEGERRCRADVVQTCAQGEWSDTRDCAEAQQTCIDGECVGDPPDCSGLRVYDWTELEDGVIAGGYFSDHHWGTNIEHDPGSLSVVSAGDRLREPETKSLRFYIDPRNPWPPPDDPGDHDGNFRAEIYEAYQFHDGQTVGWAPDKPLRSEEWIGWSYYYPPDFIAGDTASTKFLQCHVGYGAAPIDLRLWNPTEYPDADRCPGDACDEFVLHRYFPDDGMDAEVAITDVKPEAGRWYDFVLHVVWDTESGGAGLTELWIDGVQYYSSAGGNTFENPENKDHPYGAMIKLGMYHGSWRDNEAIEASLDEGVDHLELFMGPVRILSRQRGDHIGADGYSCVAPVGPRP